MSDFGNFRYRSVLQDCKLNLGSIAISSKQENFRHLIGRFSVRMHLSENFLVKVKFSRYIHYRFLVTINLNFLIHVISWSSLTLRVL